MAYEENLAQIRARGYHYLVASRQSERQAWFDELEDDQGWAELIRLPSPRNPHQKKSRVWVKRAETAEHLYVLCRSEGRQATKPEPQQRLIYGVLGIAEEVMAPVKTWLPTEEAAGPP